MFLSVFLLFLWGSVAMDPEDRGVSKPACQPDSLTVYVFLADECVISQFFTPELSRLNKLYAPRHIGFIGYFPNANAGPEEIRDFGRKYRLPFPLLGDHDKTWTRKLGITVTPEVAIWDHREEKMIYRGRIDDSYVRVGKRKLHPQSHDLEQIIISWLDHQTFPQCIETQAIGCFITFTIDRATSPAPVSPDKE